MAADTIRLYHYGHLGERGKVSVLHKGLLTAREHLDDFYEDDEWVDDHYRVWAFNIPDYRPRSFIEADCVIFEVPVEDTDASRGSHIVSVLRSVRSDEIVSVELFDRS